MEEKAAEKTLFKVAAALLALLAATVAAYFVDLGPFNFPVALIIAAAKAVLVGAFFMELRLSVRTVRIMAGAGLVWLVLLLAGTLADVVTRVHIPPPF